MTIRTEDTRKSISHHINFDTYEVVKRLCASGMPEKQAEEVMHAIILSKEFDLSQLSTREQIVILQKEMEKYSTRDQVDALQKDIYDIRAEISNIRNDVRAEISDIRNDIRAEISDIRNDMQQYATKDQVDALQKDVYDIRNDMQQYATRDQLFSVQKDILEKIDQTKYDTIKWIVGMFITLIITIIIRPYIH